jgi:hypothetical protein
MCAGRDQKFRQGPMGHGGVVRGVARCAEASLRAASASPTTGAELEQNWSIIGLPTNHPPVGPEG